MTRTPTSTPGPTTPDPTTLVESYVARAAADDLEAYLAQLADDVVVEDEGREHRGLAAVREWRSEVPAVGYAVRSVTEDGGTVVAVMTISGDFPGSPVDLAHRFRFDAAGRIAELRIRA